MGDQNLRVWPVDGDGYGEVIEYPPYAKYRMEPETPGATGDRKTFLVVYERDETADDGEHELGRHRSSDVLIAYSGQPTPPAVLEAEHGRRSTVTSKSKTPARARTADK